MKALTIMQPWATLLMAGVKQMETRTWKTDYRGDLAIHTSVKSAMGLLSELAAAAGLPLTAFEALDYPQGAILGVVTLVDCLPFDAAAVLSLPASERALGYFTRHGYAWDIATHDRRRLKHPIHCYGHQRLWALSETMELRIRKALA